MTKQAGIKFSEFIGLRLSPRTFTRLRRIAISQDLKVAEMARVAIEEWLDIPGDTDTKPKGEKSHG